MEYKYSLKKDINGNYYIKFINFFDKNDFRNDIVSALKEIIPNWETIKETIRIIDSDIADEIEENKKDGIFLSEYELWEEEYQINNYVKTDIGTINIIINGMEVEIGAKENPNILKTISAMLEKNYLFHNIIDEL